MLGLDEPTTIALIVGLSAVVCVALAVQRFSAQRLNAAVIWSVLAAVLGFTAWFFVTMPVF